MVSASRAFRRVPLSALTIEGERALASVPLYARLKDRLVRDRYAFRVPPPGAEMAWSRAVFLNLSFWTPEDGGDVLCGRRIPADVVAHVGWHHAASRALGEDATSAEGLLLGESIASAFDLYLVGVLLPRAPDHDFLRTQVPALAEEAASAGVSARAFRTMLAAIARDPEGAFGELRALLFSVSTALLAARGVDAAARVLERSRGHRFSSLLHHYNLSTWILYARAFGTPATGGAPARIDRALRRAPRPLAWLERSWLSR